jgi:WD40 repeat protein
MSDFSLNIDNDKIDIDENDSDKNNPDKPHNGKPITTIEVSPNGKYLVTYSAEDKSIVGWNVDDHVEGQLKLDCCHNIEKYEGIIKICVSDDNILALIYDDYYELGKL